jgi:thiamine kinase-like enzyme
VCADNFRVGNICRQPIQDIIAEPFPKQIFSSVQDFHDWFTALANRHHPDPAAFVDLMRGGLPDDAPITFTHGDLHPRNIIISSRTDDSKLPRILAIIDWYQSGWYPAYWEYCKAVYAVDPESHWARDYIPKILEHPECFDHWFTWMPWMN